MPVAAAEPLLAVVPPVGWLLVVLGVHALVVVPVVLWGLGRADHRGLAWVILPVFSAAITAGLWLYVHQQVAA